MGERRRRNKQLAKNGANSNKGNREEDLHGVLAQQMEAKRQREQSEKLQEKQDLIKHYENYNVGGLAPEDDVGEESGIQGLIDAAKAEVAHMVRSGATVIDTRQESVTLESDQGLPQRFVEEQKKSLFAPMWPQSNPAPGPAGGPAAPAYATPAAPGSNLTGSSNGGTIAEGTRSREEIWAAKRQKYLKQQGKPTAPAAAPQQHAAPPFQQMQMHANAPQPARLQQQQPPQQAPVPTQQHQNAAPPSHHMQQPPHGHQQSSHQQHPQQRPQAVQQHEHHASGEIDIPDASGGINQIGASGHSRQKQVKRQLQQDYQKFMSGQQNKNEMVSRIEGLHRDMPAGGGPHQQVAPPSGRRSARDEPQDQEGLGLGIGREGQSQSEHFRRQERAEMQQFLQKEASKHSARRGQAKPEEQGLDLGKTRQLEKEKLREEQQREMQSFMREQKRGSRRGDHDGRVGSAEQGLGLGQEQNHRQKMIREQQKKDLDAYMQSDQYNKKHDQQRTRDRDHYDSSGPPPFPQQPPSSDPAPDQQHHDQGQQGAYPPSPHRNVSFTNQQRAIKPHAHIEPSAQSGGGAVLGGFGMDEAMRQKKRADMQEEMRAGLAQQVEESRRKKEAEERQKKIEDAREQERFNRERQRSEEKVMEYERSKKGGSQGSAGMGPSHSHGPPPPVHFDGSSTGGVLPPRHPGPPSIAHNQMPNGNAYPPPPPVAAQRPPPHPGYPQAHPANAYPGHYDDGPQGSPPPNPILQVNAMTGANAGSGTSGNDAPRTGRDEKLFSALMEQQKSLHEQNQTQVQSLRQDLEALRKDRDDAQKAFLDMKEQHLKEKEQELEGMKEQVMRQQFYSSSSTPVPGQLPSGTINGSLNLGNTFSTIAEDVKEAARFVPKYGPDDIPPAAQQTSQPPKISIEDMPLPVHSKAKIPPPLPPVKQPANYNDAPHNAPGSGLVGFEATPPEDFDKTLPSKSKLVSVVDMKTGRAWTGRTYKPGQNLGEQMSARNLPVFETSSHLVADASRTGTPQDEQQPAIVQRPSRRSKREATSKPSSADHPERIERQERRESERRPSRDSERRDELKEGTVQKEASMKSREHRQEMTNASDVPAPESRELPPLKMPNKDQGRRSKLSRHDKPDRKQRDKMASFSNDRQEGLDEGIRKYDDKRFADIEKRFTDSVTVDEPQSNGGSTEPLKNVDLSRKVTHGQSAGFLQSAVAALREFRGPQKERSLRGQANGSAHQASTTSLHQTNASVVNESNNTIEDDRQSTADSIDGLLLRSSRPGYPSRSPKHHAQQLADPRRHKFHGSLPSPSPSAAKNEWNDTGNRLRASAPITLPSASNSPDRHDKSASRRSRKAKDSGSGSAQQDGKPAVLHGLRDLPPLQNVRSPMNRHLTVSVQQDDDAKSFGTSIEFNPPGAQTPSERNWVVDPHPLPDFNDRVSTNDRELAPAAHSKSKEFSEGFRKSFDKEKITRDSVDKETRESLKGAIRAVKEEHKNISISAPGAPPLLQPVGPPTYRSDSNLLKPLKTEEKEGGMFDRFRSALTAAEGLDSEAKAQLMRLLDDPSVQKRGLASPSKIARDEVTMGIGSAKIQDDEPRSPLSSNHGSNACSSPLMNGNQVHARLQNS